MSTKSLPCFFVLPLHHRLNLSSRDRASVTKNNIYIDGDLYRSLPAIQEEEHYDAPKEKRIKNQSLIWKA
ncbi:hypothetical protein L1987_40453 [Smallanthus sonchifolius]|uniref:Uncharacterized protein n=1 Tax=Smallanthus sonchifolius TaxID=185202 RepID=A0ACB9GT15_9ASTR|nr:hypothetical protein L1987_40453 [Smallanthus sonchifolius]